MSETTPLELVTRGEPLKAAVMPMPDQRLTLIKEVIDKHIPYIDNNGRLVNSNRLADDINEALKAHVADRGPHQRLVFELTKDEAVALWEWLQSDLVPDEVLLSSPLMAIYGTLKAYYLYDQVW